MKRDVFLKPRKSGSLPPEKLREILSRIYPESTVIEVMESLGYKVKEDTDE